MNGMFSIRCFIYAIILAILPFKAVNAKDHDVTAHYTDRDFSRLIQPSSEFLGYIGKEYQRLGIYFTEVRQNPQNHAEYKVKGFSEVKSHRNDFQGTITVNRIIRLDEMHYGTDDEYKTQRLKAQGRLYGEYDLKEDTHQPYAGRFTGKMTLDWYEDRAGMMKFDDIENDSDSYRNNQYEGIWVAGASDTGGKVANWGEYRIPHSAGLDDGAGEFEVAPLYKNKGLGW